MVAYREQWIGGDVRVDPAVLTAAAARLEDIAGELRDVSRLALGESTQAWRRLEALHHTGSALARVTMAWEQADAAFARDLDRLADGLHSAAVHYRASEDAVRDDFALFWT